MCGTPIKDKRRETNRVTRFIKCFLLPGDRKWSLARRLQRGAMIKWPFVHVDACGSPIGGIFSTNGGWGGVGDTRSAT